jgi:hypothetical protein
MIIASLCKKVVGVYFLIMSKPHEMARYKIHTRHRENLKSYLNQRSFFFARSIDWLVGYLTALYELQMLFRVELYETMIVNGEMKRIVREAAVAYSMILCQQLSRKSEVIFSDPDYF